MTVLCGVDFSETSLLAVQAAAALAKLSRSSLMLVHAVEGARGEGASPDELVAFGERRLAQKAARLREQGVQVEIYVGCGVPDDVLLEAARSRPVSFIVVGALGQRGSQGTGLGGHADRLAHRAHVPVLVVRDSEPFEAWSRGERSLKVLLGADFSATTQPAIRLAAELARLGPCAITATHLYWPPIEWARLGLSGIRPLDASDPEVSRAIERDLATFSKGLVEAATVRIRAEPNLGSIGEHLVRLASEEKADLVVVGSRAHGRLRRLWEGSVSRAVLESAQSSVACVPSSCVSSVVKDEHRPSSVLVATDFSTTGEAAIRFAYDLARDHSEIHLVHVAPRAHWDSLEPHDIFGACPDGGSLSATLAKLVPDSARPRDLRTEVHVLNSENRADAICQAAERLGVDTIYLGTHGRGGLSRALLGSVSAGVLARTKRRVVLVHPPADESADKTLSIVA